MPNVRGFVNQLDVRRSTWSSPPSHPTQMPFGATPLGAPTFNPHRPAPSRDPSGSNGLETMRAWAIWRTAILTVVSGGRKSDRARQMATHPTLMARTPLATDSSSDALRCVQPDALAGQVDSQPADRADHSTLAPMLPLDPAK